ncbi:hypothetical protein RM530_05745 [Algiphilus sp. W345]|uniref:Uncharacterized protein n=1 Tax=Banduia mediterranea TaxID=3075609 RepID=A0ABU2WG65_9GAMM|nr:hypothetical protein [Algiphilus sp. W345]MDT0496866.1 hypothetical protein [Algiphilus sp. W345]
MTDQANIVLEHLRAMRNEIADLKKEMLQGFTNVEHRLGRVEATVGELHTDYAALSGRIDQVQADVRVLKSRTETVG